MIIMKKCRINSITSLNEYDRKVLAKYTKSYTNFIESATAENKILTGERSTTAKPNYLNT
jgi:hypothetical protein